VPDIPAHIPADIPADVDRRIDALFALEPSMFTAMRGGEVKELRDAGRDDDAARIKALRRPTVAAWALNQMVRAQPDVVDELLAVAEGLRAEQETALAGNATEFRRLLDRRRELERRLVDAAVARVVDSPSNPGAARDEIAGAVAAAAADPAVGAALRAGRLERAPTPPTGFDLLAGLDLPAAPPKPKQKPKHQRSPSPSPSPANRPAPPVDELAAKRAAAEAAREQARAGAARAERVEVAATRRQRAKVAADDAHKELRRLETELARARRAADRADAELEQAEEAERRART
jgi:hypothetical protein